MISHDDYFIIAKASESCNRYLPTGQYVSFNNYEIKLYYDFDELVTAMRRIAPIRNWRTLKCRGFRVMWGKHQAGWN